MADAANKVDRAGQDDANQSGVEEQDRISGSRPASRYYEPLPIGAEAFAVPLPKTPSEPPAFSARAKVVSLIVGVAAGVGAGALLLAFVLKPAQPSKSAPGAGQSAHDSQSERAVVEESAPATLPAATEEAAPVPTPEGSIEHSAAAAATATATPSAAAAEPERGDLAPATDSVAPPKSARHSSHHADKLLSQPDRAEVIAAMKAVQPAVRECFGDVRGTVMANMKILGRSGRVATAQVTGQPGPIGSCVARAVRQARFPKFTAESLTISYPLGR